MRLEQLKYIIEIAECKSISKAAKKLYISQPSLSKAVSHLEAELGTTLFVRHQHGITLTTEGEKITQKAKYILETINEIKEIPNDLKQEQPPTILKISFPYIMCNEVFINILFEIQRNPPAMHIIPFQKSTYETISALQNNFLDFGVISFSTNEKENIYSICQESKLTCINLSKEEFYVVVRKKHSLANFNFISVDSCNDFFLVTLSDLIESNLDFYNHKCIYVPNFDIIDSILANSDNITILPRIGAITCKGVRQGYLQAIPITNFPKQHYISLIFHTDHSLSKEAQAFMNLFNHTYEQICAF